MIVVDASALTPALADDGEAGTHARARFRGEYLVAPEIIDLEILSVLRRQVAAGLLEPRRAEFALRHLLLLVMRRASHLPHLARCWELRHTVSPYDATYVALAEAMGVHLVTADRRLARAPGIECEVEVLGTSAAELG